MKKILFSILAVAMIVSLFTFSAGAESLATTFEEVYVGEYDSGVHTGECCIIFGTVSDTNVEYGVIITDEEGKSYKFLGKNIGEEGKFGIAIYNMPLGEYTAKVYSGASDSCVFGDEISISMKPTFVVSTANAKAGDTNVEITIFLKHNPGIASIKQEITYADELTLTGVVYNSTIGGMSMPPQKNDSPVTLNWFNGIADSEGDWVFATLSFDISSTANAGEYDISLTYAPDDVCDITDTNIDFAVVNGKIIVE